MGDIETLLAGCDTLMATYDFFWVGLIGLSSGQFR